MLQVYREKDQEKSKKEKINHHKHKVKTRTCLFEIQGHVSIKNYLIVHFIHIFSHSFKLIKDSLTMIFKIPHEILQ